MSDTDNDKENNNIIITHAGSFHADEIMAIALLEKFYFINPLKMIIDEDEKKISKWLNNDDAIPCGGLYFEDGVEDCRSPVAIIRTRNNSLLSKAKKNPNTFVLDVGGEYDKSKLNFDHHQKSMNEKWNDGTPFSATGLVWMWLKENNYLSSLEGEVIEQLENKVIKRLDANDNGVSHYDVATTASTFNRLSTDSKEQDRQFFKAKIFMLDFLNNAIYSETLKLDAKKVLKEQWQKAKNAGDTCVFLTKSHPYPDLTNLLKEVSKDMADIIIIPGQGNRFSVVSLPLDKPFSIKTPVPKDWRGKLDFKATIDNQSISVAFAHKSGFMCVVEGKRSDALKVARHIVKTNNFNKGFKAKSIKSEVISKVIKKRVENQNKSILSLKKI